MEFVGHINEPTSKPHPQETQNSLLLQKIEMCPYKQLPYNVPVVVKNLALNIKT